MIYYVTFISNIYGLIIDPHYNLITQLVEHCVRNAEVRVRVAFRPRLLEAWLALTSVKYHGNL